MNRYVRILNIAIISILLTAGQCWALFGQGTDKANVGTDWTDTDKNLSTTGNITGDEITATTGVTYNQGDTNAVDTYVETKLQSQLIADSDYTSLALAISDAGTTVETHILVCQDNIIADGTTMAPADNITLDFTCGGTLAGVAGGGTETFAPLGNVIIPNFQPVFGSNLTVDLSAAHIDHVSVDWWPVDGTADEVQINAALVASGGRHPVVAYGNSYYIDASITPSYGDTLICSGMALVSSQSGADRGTVISTDDTITMLDISGTSTDSDAQMERVLIKNCTFDGGAVATNAGKVWDFRRIKLENVLFKSATNCLLAGRTTASDVSYQLVLDNVHLTNCTDGFTTSGTNSHVFIAANAVEIRSMSDNGIQGDLTGYWNAGFIGAIGGYGAYLSGSQNLTFVNLITENCGSGTPGFTGGDVWMGDDCQNINILGGGRNVSSASYGAATAINIDDNKGGSIIGYQCSTDADSLVTNYDDLDFIGITVGANCDDMTIKGISFEGDFTNGSRDKISVNATAFADNDIDDDTYHLTKSFWETSGVGQAIGVRQAGDSVDRIRLDTNGKAQFSADGITNDVDLYSSASNVLKTDDQFVAADGIILKGNAGACDDSVFTVDTNNNMCIDTTNKTLMIRIGGAWYTWSHD